MRRRVPTDFEAEYVVAALLRRKLKQRAVVRQFKRFARLIFNSHPVEHG